MIDPNHTNSQRVQELKMYWMHEKCNCIWAREECLSIHHLRIEWFGSKGLTS